MMEESAICEICGNLVSRAEYDKHLKVHNSKEKKIHTCPICFKEFINPSNYKYHLAHHGEERLFVCNECPKNYKTKIDLIQHQRSHDRKREPIRCEYCSDSFKTRSSMTSHLRMHHKSTTKSAQMCQECNKTFVNIRAHIQQVHQRIRKYVCSLCSKGFGKKSGLDRHMQTVHEKIRNWSCDLCKKSFGEKAQMERHRKIHYKPLKKSEPDLFEENVQDEEIIEDKTRYVCGICRKKLNSKAALKRHKTLVHEKKRLWLCQYCCKSYGEKSNLMRHLKSHEEIIIEKLDEAEIDGEHCECKSCGKILSTQWGLKQHENECQIRKQIKLNSLAVEETYMADDGFIEEINVKMEGDFSSEEDVNQDKEFDEIIEEEVLESLDSPLPGEDEIINQSLEFDDTTARFICNICNSTFKEKRYFQEHFRAFHCETNQNFPCQYCQETFVHRGQRLRHMRQNHFDMLEEKYKTDSNFECSDCSKKFKSEKNLQLHRTMHHKAQLYECPTCNRKFSIRASMLRHIKRVHENRRDFICEDEDCDKAFQTRYELNEHFKKIHEGIFNEESIESLTCEICEKVYKTRKSLYSHKKFVHEGIRWGTNIFQCNLCEEHFDSKYMKKKHWLIVHRNGEQKVRTCHHCSSDFQLFNDYKSHIEEHTEVSVCLICGHAFADESALFIHQETHRLIDEELKQYFCDKCSHRLSTKGQLEIHMRKHLDNADDQYICHYCGKSYKFIAPFLHHKLTHENVFDFSCLHCEKKFRKKRDLLLHERIHTGERPYKCQIQNCSKSFTFRQNYMSHLKRHEPKNYECKICLTIHQSHDKLKKHEITEHADEFPFRCNCGKVFRAEHYREAHMLKCPQEIELKNL